MKLFKMFAFFLAILNLQSLSQNHNYEELYFATDSNAEKLEVLKKIYIANSEERSKYNGINKPGTIDLPYAKVYESAIKSNDFNLASLSIRCLSNKSSSQAMKLMILAMGSSFNEVALNAQYSLRRMIESYHLKVKTSRVWDDFYGYIQIRHNVDFEVFNDLTKYFNHQDNELSTKVREMFQSKYVFIELFESMNSSNGNANINQGGKGLIEFLDKFKLLGSSFEEVLKKIDDLRKNSLSPQKFLSDIIYLKYFQSYFFDDRESYEFLARSVDPSLKGRKVFQFLELVSYRSDEYLEKLLTYFTSQTGLIKLEGAFDAIEKRQKELGDEDFINKLIKYIKSPSYNDDIRMGSLIYLSNQGMLSEEIVFSAVKSELHHIFEKDKTRTYSWREILRGFRGQNPSTAYDVIYLKSILSEFKGSYSIQDLSSMFDLTEVQTKQLKTLDENGIRAKALLSAASLKRNYQKCLKFFSK